MGTGSLPTWDIPLSHPSRHPLFHPETDRNHLFCLVLWEEQQKLKESLLRFQDRQNLGCELSLRIPLSSPASEQILQCGQTGKHKGVSFAKLIREVRPGSCLDEAGEFSSQHRGNV